MNSYSVSILDEKGGSREFELFAKDRSELTQRIADEGWVVLRIAAHRKRRAALKSDDLILLCQHLQLMLEAGLPILDALTALAEESESRSLALLCRVSAERVEKGEQLSQALDGVKVDEFFLAMIRTGEKTGRLPELLGRAAHHLQWRDDIRRKMVSSLSYPLLIILVLLIVVPLLFIYLVPQLMGFLGAQNTTLPWYTVALIAVADFSQHHGFTLLLFLVIGLLLLVTIWAVFKPVRILFDQILLKTPLIGSLVLQLKTAQLAEQLGIMYGAGIPVAEALPLISESMGNRVLCRHLKAACTELGKGKSLHAAFLPSAFPSMLLRMIKVGEISGSLDKTLSQAALLYSRQAHRRADKLSAVIGPVVLLFAGGIVIWLVAALILPLYDGLFSMGTGL